MKVCIYTLGCKVNQYESGGIEKSLDDLGYEVTDKLGKADAYIINTCAVTAEAERKSRTTITKCVKLNDKAKIFVVGCAAQDNFKQFADKPNVVYVNGNGAKTEVVKFLEGAKVSPLPENYEEYGFSENSRTRSFIKVQDGCNNFCSYCIVPYLRGRSRSRSIESVIKEISALKDVYEVVLCGINLSDYQNGGLIALAESVDKIGIRFRFGSLEVNVITDEFLNRLKKLKHFCPQFHLSLQSGSDAVLKRMNRHYTAEKYLEACEKIKTAFKIANVTTDVIVGFPDETESEFIETAELAKKVEFGDMHVFPYSKRVGTVAAKMTDLPKNVKTERAKRLSLIRDELKERYIVKNIGEPLTALTETEEDGYIVGYTENYIKMYLKNVPLNTLVPCEAVSVYKDGAIGKIRS